METQILMLWRELSEIEKKEVINKMMIYLSIKGKRNEKVKINNKKIKIVSSQLSTATTH